MNGNNGNGFPPVQDGGPDLKKVSIEDVRKYLKQDIAIAMQCLDAIYRDQPTMEAVADYLYGRLQNQLHKKELEAQRELDVK